MLIVRENGTQRVVYKFEDGTVVRLAVEGLYMPGAFDMNCTSENCTIDFVPTAIDMRQAQLMLDSQPFGEGTRLDAVEAFMATQTKAAQIEWAKAKEIRRDHPLVAIMAFFFGDDTIAVDQWFRDGAAIGPTLTL